MCYLHYFFPNAIHKPSNISVIPGSLLFLILCMYLSVSLSLFLKPRITYNSIIGDPCSNTLSVSPSTEVSVMLDVPLSPYANRTQKVKWRPSKTNSLTSHAWAQNSHKYFCESEKTFKLEECIHTLSIFCQKVNQCRKVIYYVITHKTDIMAAIK